MNEQDELAYLVVVSTVNGECRFLCTEEEAERIEAVGPLGELRIPGDLQTSTPLPPTSLKTLVTVFAAGQWTSFVVYGIREQDDE